MFSVNFVKFLKNAFFPRNTSGRMHLNFKVIRKVVAQMAKSFLNSKLKKFFKGSMNFFKGKAFQIN